MDTWKTIIYSVILIQFHYATGYQPASDSIVACGGFVRWKNADMMSGVKGTAVDYSKLRVNVLLENGKTLVDVTDVLPNGAFSLPVYGEDIYRLRLVPPDGWHVSPYDGYLLDLRKSSSACSVDFNFYVLGFTVYGQVITYGLTTGPSGLFVHVLRTDGNASILSNVTAHGGVFILAPIPPGDYTLLVSDKRKASADVELDHIIRARGSVHVDADNVHASDPLVLLGNYLHGSVMDFHSKPCSSCLIWLLSQSVNLTAVGCNMKFDLSIREKLSQQLELKRDVYTACQTKVDPSGHFSFERLPGGRYLLLPHHHRLAANAKDHRHAVNYTFQPPFLTVDMQHTDMDLTSDSRGTFVASGIELPSGRVSWPDGKPIAGATVSISGLADTIVTDIGGFYQPGSVKPDHVTITAKSAGAQFASFVFDLSAGDTSAWPLLTPIRLSVCGRFSTSSQSWDLVSSPEKSQRLSVNVVFTARDQSSPIGIQTVQAERDNKGEFSFCSYLPPGEYTVTPDVTVVSGSKEEHRPSLPFTPSPLALSLVDGPASLVFTQFSGNLIGRLVCLLPGCADRLLETGALALKLTTRTTSSFVGESSGEEETASRSLLVPVLPLSRRRASAEDHSVVEFETTAGVPSGDYSLELVLLLPRASPQPVALAGWCWDDAVGHLLGSPSASTARALHIGDRNLSWSEEPALDFRQSGHLVHVTTAKVTWQWSDEPGEGRLELPQTTVGWLRLSLDTVRRAPGGEADDGRQEQEHTSLLWRIVPGNSQICVPPASKERRLSYSISVSSSCLDLQLTHPSSGLLDPVKDFSPLESAVPELRIAVTRIPVSIEFAYPPSMNWSTVAKAKGGREPVSVELVATTNTTVVSSNGGETQELPQHQPATQSEVAWSAPNDKKAPSASLIHWVEMKLPAKLHADQSLTVSTHLVVRSKKETGGVTKQPPTQWHPVHFLPSDMKQSVTVTMRLGAGSGKERIRSPLLVATEKVTTDCGGEARKPLPNDLLWLPILRFVLQPGVVLRGQIVPPVEQVKVRLWLRRLDGDTQGSAQEAAAGGATASSAPQPRLLPIFSEEDAVGFENSNQQSEAAAHDGERHIDAAGLPSCPPKPLASCYSDSAGVFHFGPLAFSSGIGSSWIELLTSTSASGADPTSLFAVSLEKPGFQFTSRRPPSTANNWLFESMKLSLVRAAVVTSEDKKPLAGVLVSIIGDSYRESMLTNEEGVAQFVGLAQGQYYIRPMMKEFAFTLTRLSPSTGGAAAPSSTGTAGAGSKNSATPIEVVAGGPDVTVEITAKRTAFSLFGKVLSLARHPMADVTVEARWLTELPPSQSSVLGLDEERTNGTENVTCQLTAGGEGGHLRSWSSVPREQATTDANGLFRLRGLLPGCAYSLQVQQPQLYPGSSRGGTSAGTSSISGSPQQEQAERQSPSTTIDRVIPPVIQIVMPARDTDLTSTGGDAGGLVFYVFHQLHLTTLTASVDVADEFRDSLQLTLFPADHPEAVLARHNFKTDSLLFSLSGPVATSLADKEYVMRLDSSLSPLVYSGVSGQDKVLRLKPGLSEHIRFTFQPALRLVHGGHSTMDEL